MSVVSSVYYEIFFLLRTGKLVSIKDDICVTRTQMSRESGC